QDDDLVALYQDALALVYVPFDEDYGLATLESFLAAKPVVTATDSGGTLEFVEDGVNGFVVNPDSAQVAEAIAALDGDRARARRMGEAGRALARGISWDTVIERLVSHV
ncbi:MAG: glycosyltransferase, partial [Acidobacteriota bacterium]|nr:glycosyltransferase [Acidobacteriota bacterium]